MIYVHVSDCGELRSFVQCLHWWCAYSGRHVWGWCWTLALDTAWKSFRWLALLYDWLIPQQLFVGVALRWVIACGWLFLWTMCVTVCQWMKTIMYRLCTVWRRFDQAHHENGVCSWVSVRDARQEYVYLTHFWSQQNCFDFWGMWTDRKCSDSDLCHESAQEQKSNKLIEYADLLHFARA